MLDTYIIDRIRRDDDRANRRNSRIPLHIDDRRPPPEENPEQERRQRDERGSAIIDYKL